jgi:hypothetical protein
MFHPVTSYGILKLLKSSLYKNTLKKEILVLSKMLNRGLINDSENENKIQSLFKQLEELNLNNNTLSNPNLSGVWNLEYTSSKTLLGQGKLGRTSSNILQKINIKQLKAENSEIISYFGLPSFKSSVTANLYPVTKSKVDVLFDRFSIGPIKFNAPKGVLYYYEYYYYDYYY